jgi:hypothetical protein
MVGATEWVERTVKNCGFQNEHSMAMVTAFRKLTVQRRK